MRWIVFFSLLYLAAAFQSAHLAQWSEQGYFHIEYLPLLGIFYAFYAEEDSALLACFWCGLLYDLTSQALLGLEAILLALMALGIVKIRLHIFRNNPISQGVITFLAVSFFLAGRMVLTRLALWNAGQPAPEINIPAFLGVAASSSLYTAVLVPWLFRLLLRLGSLLGFEGAQRRDLTAGR